MSTEVPEFPPAWYEKKEDPMLPVKIQGTGTVETPEEAEKRRLENESETVRMAHAERRRSYQRKLESMNPIMRYFTYDHLTQERMRDISAPFFVLAEMLVTSLPDGDEKEYALRSLLTSKDAAVRAVLEKT